MEHTEARLSALPHDRFRQVHPLVAPTKIELEPELITETLNNPLASGLSSRQSE
jgi:hypothetical protein